MAIVGTGGGVYIDTNKVAEIASWSLDLGVGNIDVTTFDSNGWKEFLAGLKEWSGSFEGNYKPDDTAGQKALITAWVNGTTVNLVLKVNDTVSFSGNALIKPKFDVKVDDKAGVSFDFQGTGALTVPA